MHQTNSNDRGETIPSRRSGQPRSACPPDVPLRDSRHEPCRWDTIRDAIGSTAKTLRFCLIVLVMIIPPGLLVVLSHRLVGIA
jgi:hypothetical protein